MALVFTASLSEELAPITGCEYMVFPPIENKLGDIIFVPNAISFVATSQKDANLRAEKVILTFTIFIVALISIITWFKGGRFMYYVPLYLALLPVFFWVAKIAYAFVLTKYSSPTHIIISSKEKEFSSMSHEVADGTNYLDAVLSLSREIESKRKSHE